MIKNNNLKKEERGTQLPTHPHMFGVILAGLEPTTCGLEGRCSIQLSYRTVAINIQT
jgi:hypothetical protein